MGYPLRSHSREAVKFPILCTAKIDIQILKTLLYHEELVLVATKDLSKLITDGDELHKFESPFDADLSNQYDSLRDFATALQHTPQISRKALVVLDAITAKDRTTCYVGTDIGDDDEASGFHIAFRCNLNSVTEALIAVQQASDPIQTVRILRNEAAMIGGVWDEQRAQVVRNRPEHIQLSDYPVHSYFDDSSDRDEDELYSSDLHYPVFRTAHISLATINQFLKETYDQNWGEDGYEEGEERQEILHVAFVTSIDNTPFHAGKTRQALDTVPPIPNGLLGASPAECDAIVRSRFAAADSELNYNQFIIMDQLTEQEQTVILAGNDEVDGQLILTRCSFHDALLSLVATIETCLTMESQCCRAVTEARGVICDELSS